MQISQFKEENLPEITKDVRGDDADIWKDLCRKGKFKEKQLRM